MRSRSDLVEIFSSFLSFDGDSSGSRTTWTADAALRRSMRQALQAQASGLPEDEVTEEEMPEDETSWAIHWHRLWSQAQAVDQAAAQTGIADSAEPQSRRIANHLIAYLQEPGYWGAHKVFRSLRSAPHQYLSLIHI